MHGPDIPDVRATAGGGQRIKENAFTVIDKMK